jgi:hypothetical protein
MKGNDVLLERVLGTFPGRLSMQLNLDSLQS